MSKLTDAQQARLDAAWDRYRATTLPGLTPAQREVALAFPPFYLHRIEATGQVGRLSATTFTPTGEVQFEPLFPPSLNPGSWSPTPLIVFGLAPEDLELVEVSWDLVEEYLQLTDVASP